MPRTNSVRNGSQQGNTAERNGKRRKRLRKPEVRICVNDNEIRFQPDELLDPEIISGLRETLQAANTPVQFEIINLLGWPDEPDNSRWELLSLISSLDVPYTVRRPGFSRGFGNLFDAVLSALEGDKNIERCERGKRAALEAAALVYPHALETACSRIAKRFKELKVSGTLPQTLLKTAKKIVGGIGQDEELTPLRAAEAYVQQLQAELELQDNMPLNYYRQSFYVWTGQCWRERADDEFRSQVVRFLQRRPDCERMGDRFARDVLTHLRGIALLDCWDVDMPLWIETREPLAVDAANSIVFSNGMIEAADLRGQDSLSGVTMHELDSRNFSTVSLPFEFDADATCPLWEQTLRDIFPRRGDEDWRIDILQEFFGYTLNPGDTSLHKFIVMTGNGANGKSTILFVLEALLGNENVSHVLLEHLNGEFRIAEMAGKIANIAADMTYVNKVAEGTLKSLTSGDPIQVNRKHKQPVTMVPTARLLFATNALPQINDRSDGVWRRMIAMPFFRKFSEEERDRERGQRLLTELPGIFNWAVQGAKRLYRQDRFSECAICRRCANEHRTDSDPFRLWKAERIVLDPECASRREDVYADYVEFCDDNGRKPTNSALFRRRLLELPGVQIRRPGSGSDRPRFYFGIRFLSGKRSFQVSDLKPQSNSRRRRRSNGY